MGAINKPATRQSAQHTLRPPRPTASPPPDHQTHLTPPCAPTCFPRCVRSMPRHPPQPAKRKACSLRSGARNKNHVTDRLHAKARRRFPSNRGPHSGRPDGAICDSRRALTKHMRRLRPEGRHTAGSECWQCVCCWNPPAQPHPRGRRGQRRLLDLSWAGKTLCSRGNADLARDSDTRLTSAQTIQRVVIGGRDDGGCRSSERCRCSPNTCARPVKSAFNEV